jgi:hypothetical protein
MKDPMMTETGSQPSQGKTTPSPEAEPEALD